MYEYRNTVVTFKVFFIVYPKLYLQYTYVLLCIFISTERNNWVIELFINADDIQKPYEQWNIDWSQL